MNYDENQALIQCTYGNVCKNENNASDNLLDQYLKDNPKTGYLIFQIYQDSPLYGRMPVPNVKVTINGDLGDGTVMTKVFMSNQDGKTEPIPLPTVNGAISLSPEAGKPYSTYNAVLETADFLSVNLSNIPIFDNVTSIQPVSLVPNANTQSAALLSLPSNYFYGWGDENGYYK